MKKGLLLPGYACKSWIWSDLAENINLDYNLELIEWPVGIINEFHCIRNFAEWLDTKIIDTKENIEFIIGHSMGGLVALYLAKLHPEKIRTVVLIESFIISPSSFFQNLLMKHNINELEYRINKMLYEEKKHYSPHLQSQLRNLDMIELVIGLKNRIIAIYGDRGIKNSKEVVKNLGLPEDILSKINYRIVTDSCHFPMLENPDEIANYLRELL